MYWLLSAPKLGKPLLVLYISESSHETFSFRCSKQTISVSLSPQANYTDWATTTCWRNLVPTFVGRGVSRRQCGKSPTVVNLSFLDRSCYFSSTFFLIYPHKGLSGPRSRPTATQKIWWHWESNPGEDKWGATWKKISGSSLESWD
jgi:hypothetical protein